MASEDKIQELLKHKSPGWFENLGIRYYEYLTKKTNTRKKIHKALSDKKMVWAVRKITITGFLIVFFIGAISTGGSIFTEHIFPSDSCESYMSVSCFEKYGWITVVTLLLTLIEFAVLFWVSIRTVYTISIITGHSEDMNMNVSFASQIPGLLSRAALEIPDPVLNVFGIDPLSRVSHKRLLFIGILYKVKIALSNVLAKLFLRRVLGKSFVRVSTDFIAAPITGLWNGFVVFKVAREARLRLFGNLLARHIVSEMFIESKLSKLSQVARLACLQALGNSIVLTQNYHPNMLILLVQLSDKLDYEGDQILDDWSLFCESLGKITDSERFFVLDLLAVATAFDGKISKLERNMLKEAFLNHTDQYFERIHRLKNHLISGRLYAAIDECMLDFEAG